MFKIHITIKNKNGRYHNFNAGFFSDNFFLNKLNAPTTVIITPKRT